MNRYVIDKSKLTENIKIIKQTAGVPVIAVLKGDAYGFGLKQTAQLMYEQGIRCFAVSEISDLIALRGILPEAEMLVLRSTCIPEEAEEIVRCHGIATVGSLLSAEIMDNASRRLGAVTKCHIKIDTGLGRYGFLPAQTADSVKCFALQNIEIVGAYTHFSSAFGNRKRTEKQLALFKDAVQKMEENGVHIPLLHAANSSALMRFGNLGLDRVRIGSAFGGRVAAPHGVKLNRVGILMSEVTEVKTLEKGSAVGYGGTFKTKRRTKIAVIPIGHYDGFGLTNESESYTPRIVLSTVKKLLLRKHLYVTIHEKQYRVIGKIGLSHTVVDVTDSDVKAGDIVSVDLSPLMLNPQVPKIYT